MSCKCQQPKKIKNSAGGVDFYVCAKSLGGCGQEIGGFRDTVDFIAKSLKESFSKTFVGQVNPHKPKVIECPECYGGGMVAKLYPNGHTEVSCEYCDGIGEVEL